MKIGFAVSIVATALIVASCGGSSGDSGGAKATDCAGAAQALCSKLDSCSHLTVALLYGSVSACATRATISCKAEAHASGSGMTEAQFAACANASAALSCNDLISGTKIPAECNLPGSRADGEPCGFDSQCKSTQCSVSSGLCGTCSPRAAAGGSCGSSSDCQEGLNCVNQVCAIPVAAGGACTSTDACQGLLFCKNGLCAQPLAAGASCSATSDCDLANGVVCDSTTNKCAAAAIANAGEACGEVKPVGCAANGKCVATAPQATSGTCTAAIADGAACTPSDKCLPPAECVNGVCTLPTSNSCG